MDKSTYRGSLSRAFSAHIHSVELIWLKPFPCHSQKNCRERSGSEVECLTRDRGAAGSSLTGVTALCPSARHINPSLVLVQPRKTHPYITERLLMGRKESYQTNHSQKNCLQMVSAAMSLLLQWSFRDYRYIPTALSSDEVISVAYIANNMNPDQTAPYGAV